MCHNDEDGCETRHKAYRAGQIIEPPEAAKQAQY